MGPKVPRSALLTPEEETTVVAFRRHTHLPSAMAVRHGYFHIDIAEFHTEEGKPYLFAAIDRTSKPAYAELHESQRRTIAVGFLIRLAKKVPYRIHTVLTGGRPPAHNGIQFANRAVLRSVRAAAGRRVGTPTAMRPRPLLRRGERNLERSRTREAPRYGGGSAYKHAITIRTKYYPYQALTQGAAARRNARPGRAGWGRLKVGDDTEICKGDARAVEDFFRCTLCAHGNHARPGGGRSRLPPSSSIPVVFFGGAGRRSALNLRT